MVNVLWLVPILLGATGLLWAIGGQAIVVLWSMPFTWSEDGPHAPAAALGLPFPRCRTISPSSSSYPPRPVCLPLCSSCAGDAGVDDLGLCDRLGGQRLVRIRAPGCRTRAQVSQSRFGSRCRIRRGKEK